MVAFKIKNGLETGRYTSAVGTVGSGPDLDLSTGTYFQSSIGADTTFSFSNPPPSGKAFSFTLEVTATDSKKYSFGNTLPTGISTQLYYGTNSSYDDYRIIRVRPDESSLFTMVRYSTQYQIQDHSLTTPGDITTLVRDAYGDYMTTTDFSDFYWNDDGTRMYKHQSNGVIYWKNTTAYTPSNPTVNSFNLGSSSRQRSHIADSGTRLYVTDHDTDTVRQYSLSTAWDTGTATYVQDSPVVDAGLYGGVSVIDFQGLYFTPDGLYFYISMRGSTGGHFKVLRKFEMSTAWDVSTATLAQENYINGTGPNASFSGCFDFNSDGSTMYMFYYDYNEGFWYAMSIPTEEPLLLTWPTSVKWSGGEAPSAPLDGEKKLFNFFTTDGGTTYYGSEAYEG